MRFYEYSISGKKYNIQGTHLYVPGTRHLVVPVVYGCTVFLVCEFESHAVAVTCAFRVPKHDLMLIACMLVYSYVPTSSTKYTAS